MSLRILLLLWLTMACASWAAPPEACSIDGIAPGQAASALEWPTRPSKNGQFRHQKTVVEIKDGFVIAVTGTRLLTPEGAIIECGESGPAALSKVGKPDRILYGCGKDSQQVNFYDTLGILITVTNGKVTGLRSARK